jgi:hypothetical protein
MYTVSHRNSFLLLFCLTAQKYIYPSHLLVIKFYRRQTISLTESLLGIIEIIISSCSDTDVHTVASLLKLYLRELPEPVVPWSQYQDFLSCTYKIDPSTTVRPAPHHDSLTLISEVIYLYYT